VNFLGAILETTRRSVEERKARFPLDELRGRPLYGRTPLSLSAALRAASPAIIAEIKRASPSRGVIRTECDPFSIADGYMSAGAAAISVLTEEKYFLGSLRDLEAARSAVSIPVLRKDFLLDPYQVHESKSSGADAILLIAAALSAGDLIALRDEARSLGMEALVEVHSPGELALLAGAGLTIVGINNRDLVTFQTDIALSETLGPRLGPETLGVSESGIRSGREIARLSGSGIRAFLVGEHLMSAHDPGKALAELIRSAGENS
jgi:indole-3-glycerol phosphate synthase